MDLRVQLNSLESRQLELYAIMKSSDEHMLSCIKQGEDFSKKYPDEKATHAAAREEYNKNEDEIANIRLQLEAEESMYQANRLAEE